MSKQKLQSIPKKIKIGCFTYTINQAQDDVLGSIGRTDTDRLQIDVDITYPAQTVKETLFHECLHAVLCDTFVLDDETEEKLIRVLSPKLIALLSNNKQLTKYLFS